MGHPGLPSIVVAVQPHCPWTLEIVNGECPIFLTLNEKFLKILGMEIYFYTMGVKNF